MEVDWDHWKPQIRANLTFVRKGDRVLLIRKKTGFGKGKINGPGGKLEEGETILESAHREMREELHIDPIDPQPRGVLRFQFTDGLSMHVVVFLAHDFKGEPTETVEAAPLWFPVDAIPFAEMWEDDQHWLPQLLGGQTFDSWWVFEGEKMLSKRIEFGLPRPG